MTLLVISTIESAYILYMFNIFKTKKNFESEPCCVTCDDGGWDHETGDSKEPTSKICDNGKKLSYVAALYLMGRNWRFNRTVNYIILGAGAIGAFMLNKNAFVYLIPVFGAELLLV